MKKAMVLLSVLSLLLLCIGSSYGEDVKKPKGKSVMINVKLESEVDGKLIKMVPRVLTLDKHTATIRIGDSKAELNNKPVKSDKEIKDLDKTFLTIIEVTPTIVEDVAKPIIRLDIKFSLNHNNYMIKQNFQTVVREGDSFLFESFDQTKKQKLSLSISASVPEEKTDKSKGDAETGKPCAESRDSGQE